mgnify:CR=1 FL=1
MNQSRRDCNRYRGHDRRMQMSLFVLAVVPFHPDERPARYLVVQERDGTFYLPAGRVEPGENLIAAIVRETSEEAQQLVGVLGLLGFDHEPGRMRFVWACYRAVARRPSRSPIATRAAPRT